MNDAVRTVAMAIAISAATACQRAPAPATDRPPSTPTPAASALQRAAGDEPMLAGSYEATSRTAMSITGDVQVTAEQLTFSLGATYRTRLARRVPASDEYAAGAGAWADLLNVARDDRIEVRAVVEERVDLKAPNGGLCGSSPVTSLALVAAPDVSGAPSLKMAAFTGSEPPGPAAGADRLCGTFTYGSAGRL